jgi:hypothetical protein
LLTQFVSWWAEAMAGAGMAFNGRWLWAILEEAGLRLRG